MSSSEIVGLRVRNKGRAVALNELANQGTKAMHANYCDGNIRFIPKTLPSDP